MKVRDAVEGDAAALAALTDAPPPVLRNVIHDRSVRLLVDDGDDGGWAPDDRDEAQNEGAGHDEDGGQDGEPPHGTAPAGEVRGFVSFDVQDGVVHLTQFGGDSDACERLLSEPLRFARSEGLPVEALAGDGDDALREALEATGFERLGQGPSFGGTPTDRYRYDLDR
jgi:hypothetical protein